LGWITIVSAQSINDNFRIAYPELVHKGKPFQVSIITSNEIINADQLDIYLIPQRGIIPDVIVLQVENETREIAFSSSSSEGFIYDAVMCSIDLKNFVSDVSGSFFQILIKFDSEFVEYSEVDFYGEFRKNNTIVGYLNNSANELSSDYPNYHKLKINFYTSVTNGDKALTLQPNSEFNISPSFSVENDLLVDFWLKLDRTESTFLEIKNKQSGLTDYRLIMNKFQIIVPESDFNNEIKINCF
jgi:hypothetical protein